MIRLGSLAGYPFEGPRLLAGWTVPAVPAVYAVLYRPDETAESYAVIYVGHTEEGRAHRFHARVKREVAGATAASRSACWWAG